MGSGSTEEEGGKTVKRANCKKSRGPGDIQGKDGKGRCEGRSTEGSNGKVRRNDRGPKRRKKTAKGGSQGKQEENLPSGKGVGGKKGKQKKGEGGKRREKDKEGNAGEKGEEEPRHRGSGSRPKDIA